MSKLLSQVLEDANMLEALEQVKRNKGNAGVDGVTVDEIDDYIRSNWDHIRERICTRKYKPAPVLRVEIPKPNGGMRNLGIPTVMDRVIQQAIVQVLTPICEPYLHDNSFGFRPGHSCEQAFIRVLEYLNDGFEWIVDIDLEKFFDKVPQDRLMSLVHNMIQDGDVESLIRKYLQAGVQIKGQVHKNAGGHLSRRQLIPSTIQHYVE